MPVRCPECEALHGDGRCPDCVMQQSWLEQKARNYPNREKQVYAKPAKK